MDLSLKSHHQGSWILKLANENIRLNFQSFVLSLVHLRENFWGEKYSPPLWNMADTCLKVLEVLKDSKPPEDVMVSTLSGVLRTQLNQYNMIKEGTKNRLKFSNLVSMVACCNLFFSPGLCSCSQSETNFFLPPRFNSLCRTWTNLHSPFKLVRKCSSLCICASCGRGHVLCVFTDNSTTSGIRDYKIKEMRKKTKSTFEAQTEAQR